ERQEVGAAGPEHPGVRRHRQDGRGGGEGGGRDAAAGERGPPDAASREAPHPRHELRRLGRQQRRDRQPGPRPRPRPDSAARPHGAIAKAGSTAMVDVYHYAEPVTAKGFVVMDTPGYDPVSMTGIVAGGANVCVFTTGRGSVFGCKPAPSIKVATNSPLYHHMLGGMDINAGRVLDGASLEDVGRQLFEEIRAVAGGKKTKSEINGVGEEEFAPWSIG